MTPVLQGLISDITSTDEVMCPVLTGALMMGFLLLYLMEAKEHYTDLLDIFLVLPALNVDAMRASVGCLLLQTILSFFLTLRIHIMVP